MRNTVYENEMNAHTIWDCVHFASREDVFRMTEREDMIIKKKHPWRLAALPADEFLISLQEFN